MKRPPLAISDQRLAFKFFLLAISYSLCAASWAWGAYDPKGRRDPLVPLLSADGERIHPPGEEGMEISVEPRNPVTLQGIVFDLSGESYAVVNGQIVREQEEISGVKVLKIEPTRVTVLSDGRPIELSVQPTSQQEEPLGSARDFSGLAAGAAKNLEEIPEP